MLKKFKEFESLKNSKPIVEDVKKTKEEEILDSPQKFAYTDETVDKTDKVKKKEKTISDAEKLKTQSEQAEELHKTMDDGDNVDSDDESDDEETSSEEMNEDVKMYGKLAKFPKNTKAKNAYTFFENIKINKSHIWYLMVEKQDNELQMIKYNYKVGVNLKKFIDDLKTYYISKYSHDNTIMEAFKKITVDGNDKVSAIKNIPLVTVDGKKIISIITEDLIKLLSK